MKNEADFRAALSALCTPTGALQADHVVTFAKWLRLRSAILWSADFGVLRPEERLQIEGRGTCELVVRAEATLGQWEKAPFDQAAPNLLSLVAAADLDRLLMLGQVGAQDDELLGKLDGLWWRAAERVPAEEIPDGDRRGRDDLRGLQLFTTRHAPRMAALVTRGAFRVRLGPHVEPIAETREDHHEIEGSVRYTRTLAALSCRFTMHVLAMPAGARVVGAFGDVPGPGAFGRAPGVLDVRQRAAQDFTGAAAQSLATGGLLGRFFEIAAALGAAAPKDGAT